MDEAFALDLGRSTLVTALTVVAPLLIVGMLVGLAVSLVQTATAVQEQTLAIVPKMLAVAATLLALLPWILATLRDFARSVFATLLELGPMGA